MSKQTTYTIDVTEADRNLVQKADIEYCSRRDILIYIMMHPEFNISTDRKSECQKDYDDKYFAFEQAKHIIENKYIVPITNKPNRWNLDYNTCKLTITPIAE